MNSAPEPPRASTSKLPADAYIPPPVAPLANQNVIVSHTTVIPTVTTKDGFKVVPDRFECCESVDLVELIGGMLVRLIAHNDRVPTASDGLTRFHSRAPPPIPVVDYLHRITKYTNVEPAVLLILLPYVDSICSRNPQFTISSLTVHRFLIAGVSVGSKALSDRFCTNGRYARVGGVSLAEMGLLEKEFCEAIDWRLTTTGKVLEHYYTSLVRQHPLYRIDAQPQPQPQPQAPAQPIATSPSPDRSQDSTDVSMSDSSPTISDEQPPEPQKQSQQVGQDSLDVEMRGRSPALAPVNPSSLGGAPQTPLPPASTLPPSPSLHPASSIASSLMTSPDTRAQSPALIPAPGSARRPATASHLPSPVRPPAHTSDPDPAGWVGLVSRSLSGVAAGRSGRTKSRAGGSGTTSRAGGSTSTSAGAQTNTTATRGTWSSPASSLASTNSSGASGSPPGIVVEALGQGPPPGALRSPGKRLQSREPSAEGRRSLRSPLMGQGE